MQSDSTEGASPRGARRERVGAVAIGRNEGQRLVRCLDSLVSRAGRVVYVDSGSTDGSVAEAEARNCEVVQLDASIPFTAARARNAGLDRLLTVQPDIELVQFVDGDCELHPQWLEIATRFLDAHPDVAAVAGRRRERYPEATPYNRLADIEWDTPIGETDVLGGDVLVRARAIQQIGGYDSNMIAGEDPDMCLRLRQAGHRNYRLDAEMTLHDAAMTELSQWWKRTRRAGHAFAEGAAKHGHKPGRYCVRELRSIVFWGGVLPATSLLMAPATLGASLLVAGTGYGALFWKIYRHKRAEGRPDGHAALYAAATVLGKFPELQGARTYAVNRWVHRSHSRIIEYKAPQ